MTLVRDDLLQERTLTKAGSDEFARRALAVVDLAAGIPVGVLLFSAGALKVSWYFVEAETQERVPASDEQFTRLVRNLIAKLRRGTVWGLGHNSRLVVFIDELAGYAAGHSQ